MVKKRVFKCLAWRVFMRFRWDQYFLRESRFSRSFFLCWLRAPGDLLRSSCSIAFAFPVLADPLAACSRHRSFLLFAFVLRLLLRWKIINHSAVIVVVLITVLSGTFGVTRSLVLIVPNLRAQSKKSLFVWRMVAVVK